MPQFGGKSKKPSSDSKRHFTVVIGGKRASPLTPPANIYK